MTREIGESAIELEPANVEQRVGFSACVTGGAIGFSGLGKQPLPFLEIALFRSHSVEILERLGSCGLGAREAEHACVQGARRIVLPANGPHRALDVQRIGLGVPQPVCLRDLHRRSGGGEGVFPGRMQPMEVRQAPPRFGGFGRGLLDGPGDCFEAFTRARNDSASLVANPISQEIGGNSLGWTGGTA